MGDGFTTGFIVGALVMFVIGLALNSLKADARERRRHAEWRRETWRQHEHHEP